MAATVGARQSHKKPFTLLLPTLSVHEFGFKKNSAYRPIPPNKTLDLRKPNYRFTGV